MVPPGSSPLSRGIRDLLLLLQHLLRIIPALAGNTRCGSGSTRSRRDHPRSRGEYAGVEEFLVSGAGSSPLSRGIPAAVRQHRHCRGIIPALAGNTLPLVDDFSAFSDHPRSRGEYLGSVSNRAAGQGSSPLSRGIRIGDVSDASTVGIIPALAGNTELVSNRQWIGEDHPRSRGEYSCQPPSISDAIGSSPLSRGILARSWRGVAGGGIIPALAGNTGRLGSRGWGWGDHPRSRGEYLAYLYYIPGLRGSSPLSRGILYPISRAIASTGIIPALAGNTPQLCKYSHDDSGSSPLSRGILPNCANTHTMILDHPRSRGEYPDRVAGAEPHRGSSPLSRGILRMLSAIIFYHRIIPALAGNTVQMAAGCTTGRDHPRSRGEY